MSNEIKWPFGKAETLVLSASGAQALTITDRMTIIDGVAVSATADRTLNLTLDEDLEVGAQIFIKTTTDGTENTIFGTGIVGTTYAGVAAKTLTRLAVYDGTDFKVADQQID